MPYALSLCGDISPIFSKTGNNSLTGNIPTEIGELSSLNHLGFGKYIYFIYICCSTVTSEDDIISSHYYVSPIFSNIERNTLNGTIPMELGNLTFLTSLEICKYI